MRRLNRELPKPSMEIGKGDDCEDACQDNNPGRHCAGGNALTGGPSRLVSRDLFKGSEILVIIQVAVLVLIPRAVPVFVPLVPVCIALTDSRVIEIPIAAAEFPSRHAERLALTGCQSPMPR